MSITVKRCVVRGHKGKSYMARLFLTLIILMPICAPTFAGTSICWIDHVTGDVSGVRVFFRKNADIWGRLGHRPGENERRYSVREGRVVWPDREEAALLVQPGETSMVIGGVENTCEIAFAVVDGQVGISARASFTPPGVRSYADTFIPADLVAKSAN
jgi:hypothetical protein